MFFENLNFGQFIGNFDFCQKKFKNHDFYQKSNKIFEKLQF